MRFRYSRAPLAALLAGLLAPLLPAAAQETAAPGAPARPLQLDVDHAAFAFDEAHSLLEVYLAFGASSLRYAAAGEGGFLAEVPVAVALRRSAVAGPAEAGAAPPVWADTVGYRFAVRDTAGLHEGQYFVQQVRAPVPPGSYELTVAVLATTAGRLPVPTRLDVTVPDFATAGRARLADIALASALAPSEDRENPFYRSGIVLQPNPNGLFGAELPVVYYYTEAYGLDGAVRGDDYTLLAYLAEDNIAQPLPGHQRRSERPVRARDALAGGFRVDSLPSGSYWLRLALLDRNNEAVAEQARKFFVYNPGVQRRAVAAEAGAYETSLYRVMPEEEVEDNLRHVDVVATAAERRAIKSLTTVDEKRDFLAEFWRRRDEQPGTPINEARRDFYERIQYAQDRFTNAYRKGWDTDRGRVILKYGIPSAVQRNSSSSGLVPHEVWEYDNIPGEGHSMFVFADQQGFGDFRLLHSDVSGEISSIDWQRQLQR